MSYSELIKNINTIREYMRDFYVFGFKSREQFDSKSLRSYDDERRRVESWLGDYMQFRQTAEGKNVFISIDSRKVNKNPLYRAWKTKSFTDGDITLHFIIMDILESSEEPLTLKSITQNIDRYLSVFEPPRLFDESTVRKKLNEYISEGIIEKKKIGKTIYYSKPECTECYDPSVISFFSEISPCGVIGSFLLDRDENKKSEDNCNPFLFKHHYITSSLDSEIVYMLLQAMQEKRYVDIQSFNRNKKRTRSLHVVPLKLYISVQSGRQYLMAYHPKGKKMISFRTDNIVKVVTAEEAEDFHALRVTLDNMKNHIWGVSTRSVSGQRMEHVEFTLYYNDSEKHILQRLEREKRCGSVERIDANTCRFSADVYDAGELIPWIRTFICRITDIYFSDYEKEKLFKDDLEEMYRIYRIEEKGGEPK
ncbi:MAG: WYL domain-containing protein [Eubacteriaceae bacterium]|nr:WYL domain-containing protein [Eubacteriaceae bacterium]